MLWWTTRQLKSKDPGRRIQAAQSLGDSRNAKAVEPLLEALKDEDEVVQSTAAQALGKIGDARALQPLVSLLNAGNWRMQRVAAESLKSVGWQPNNVTERVGMAAALEQWNELASLGADSIQALEMFLSHESGIPKIIKAVNTLGKIGRPAVKVLTLTLLSTDHGLYHYETRAPEVKKEAAAALAKIDGVDAVAALVKVLGDYDVGQIAEERILQLGSKAIEPLVADLDYNTIKVVIKIGSPAVDRLITVLRDPYSSAKQHAAHALGGIGDPRAVEPLISMLKEEVGRSTSEQEAAATALGELRDARAVEPLILALKEGRSGLGSDVRSAAAHALGNIGDARAVEPLVGTLDHYDDQLRKASEAALQRLAGDREDLRDLLQRHRAKQEEREKEKKEQYEKGKRERAEHERLAKIAQSGSGKCSRCEAALQWWSRTTISGVRTLGKPAERPGDFAGVCTDCRDGFCARHSPESRCPKCGKQLGG